MSQKFVSLAFFTAAGMFAQSLGLTHVPSANHKETGTPAPNILSPELIQYQVATGSTPLENAAFPITTYGYHANASLVPSTPTSGEAWKTEPDKNVYLVLKNQKGADPSYNYGTHFLFQGHENGIVGTLTRINLDADGAHRVTLMAYKDVAGAFFPVLDGITWYPFSQKLLVTAEGAGGGGVWQASLDVPSKVESLTGIMGQGGYEGIQADPQGRIYIVEDSGGSTGAVNNLARRPNSFLFRFIPTDTTDLTKGGVLQVLSVKDLNHSAMYFNKYASADAHILSQDVKDLHTYGNVFETEWITIHDTATDGTAPFSANALAKSKNVGTPFKRPENGQFRPGSGFNEFLFAETGDTNLNTQAGSAYGGFGGIYRLLDPQKNEGTLTLFYLGDKDHTGLDNCAFWDANHIIFGEDAGDTLHTQRNGFDSMFVFDLNQSYSGGAQPIRIMAEGRDASATLDSAFGGFGLNDGDNETTGIHISDGDPSVNGLLGKKTPKPFKKGWRVFWTQQHGDNNTWEILPASVVESFE
jgi:Bacterial protein of unknown function (DUF839)